MNKRMLFGLVAGSLLLSMPGQAQEATWQLYGTLIAFGENLQVTGATTTPSAANSMVTSIAPTTANVPGRNRITCATSNLGFKGGLKLGPELSLIWQVESAISVDGDQPNLLAGRNSAVGLAGPSWGRVFVGNWDTPYKLPMVYLSAMRGLLPFDTNLMGNPGFNVPGTVIKTGRANDKGDASFSRRQGNSIQYWTPDWNGLSAQVGYSVNETKPTTDAPTQAQYSPTVLSAVVVYKWNTLSLFAGFEAHSDYFGLSQLTGAAGTGGTLTNAGSRDVGVEFCAIYVVPATKTRVSAIVENLTYENSDTVLANINQYKRSAWFATVLQPFGEHKAWVSYGAAGEGSARRGNGVPATTAGLGGRQFSLGYAYNVSKTVNLFASYYTMNNDRAATYGLFPQISATALNPGADSRGIGAGLLFYF